MRVRSLFFVVPIAFAVGVMASQLFVREAHAQASPFSATVYVPSDGIAFRTFDGHVIARLSYDAHGGVFEVYDEHEQVASRVRGEPLGHAPTSPPTSPPPSPAYTRDVGF